MKALLRRLWSRWYVRVLSWSLITVAVFLVLVTALVNWSGQRRWLHVKADLARQGETLDFKAVLPPPIPDERNFAAIEALRGINMIDNGNAAAAEAKRAALKRIGEAVPPKVRLPDSGANFAQKADFRKLYENWRESGEPGWPANPPDPTKAIRQALEAAGPLLKTLADAARQRPESEFVPAWRDQPLPQNLFTLQFPHYNSVMEAAKGLHLHGLACVDSGDSAAATSDALAIFRLAQACGREPLLVGYLVTAALHYKAQEILWALLAHRQVTGADLELLQRALEQLEFEKMLLFTVRGELATALSTFDALEQNASRADLMMRDTTGTQSSLLSKLACMITPAGYFSHSKATMAEVELLHLFQPLKQGGLKALLKQPNALEKSVAGHSVWTRPDYLMTKLMAPTMSLIVQKAAMTETLRRQALMACTLERYYLQHQSYPANLTDLAPAFLATVPVDITDGKPMRYRRTDAGRYLLWSIALDGKDEGGKVNRPQGDAPLSQLSKASYQGDWTWQYEPVK